MRRLLLLGLLLALVLPLAAQGRTRVRLGTIAIGASYSQLPYPYPFDPLWYRYRYLFWDPWYYHPAFFSGFIYTADKGEIRLAGNVTRDAEVYLDGAYAGPARDRRSMWLDPGAYNIVVRGPGGTLFERRVYVLSGRSLRLEAQP
jgi:hypothetical protein